MDYVVNLTVFNETFYQIAISKIRLKRLIKYLRNDGFEVYYSRSVYYPCVLDVIVKDKNGNELLFANGFYNM